MSSPKKNSSRESSPVEGRVVRPVVRVKRRIPTIYPKFDYEAHGFEREKLPSCMRVFLDEDFTSLENKEFFLQDFGYRYLRDKEFRNEVKDMVLVLEKYDYIGCMTYNEFITRETPFTRGCIRVENKNIPSSFYYSSEVSYTDFVKNLKDGTEFNFKQTNHHYMSVYLTHKKFLKEGKYTCDSQVFDTGNQVTTFPCPRYWSYENLCFNIPFSDTDSQDSSTMRISVSSQSIINSDFEESRSIEKWNEAYDHRETLEIRTTSSVVKTTYLFFKKPMYISVNNLIPKPIYVFTISLNPLIPLMPLLGLDIIEQYNYHSVFVDGVKRLIVEEPLNYEEEKCIVMRVRS